MLAHRHTLRPRARHQHILKQRENSTHPVAVSFNLNNTLQLRQCWYRIMLAFYLNCWNTISQPAKIKASIHTALERFTRDEHTGVCNQKQIAMNGRNIVRKKLENSKIQNKVNEYTNLLIIQSSWIKTGSAETF